MKKSKKQKPKQLEIRVDLLKNVLLKNLELQIRWTKEVGGEFARLDSRISMLERTVETLVENQ